MRVVRGGLAVLVGLVLLLGIVGPVAPASAAGRPIRPTYFGVQDDLLRNGSQTWGAARMWGAWCTLQPKAGTDVRRAAEHKLGRAFELYANAKRERLTVSLGHPPPWVYNNHPRALRKARVWYCGAKRSTIAFPSAKSLRSGPVRAKYVAYVTAVVLASKPYLAASKSNRVVMQAWNEPNLGSGGKINTKIPGTARTWTQAAESLREQERIIRKVAAKLIPGRFEITTPSMYGKPTKLGKPYFRMQARSRTVDSISLNFYTLGVKTPNSSLKSWKRKATRAKHLVTKYRALRSVPIWITETNHNLVNRRDNRNLTAKWTAPAVQRRLTEVTTLEAMRLGFAGIEWYQGSLRQTAVNTREGKQASVVTRRLRDELVGRSLVGCRTKKSTSWCTFTAKKGSRPIKATWSSKGVAGVTITSL